MSTPEPSEGATIVGVRSCRPRPAPTWSRRVPTSVPTIAFSDERLPNGLRLIVAEDHLAPVVAINVWYDVGSTARAARQDRLRAPVRARHVPGLAPRREGRAHRARPGRRRHDERHDLAGSHQLLRDAAGPPAGPRAVAGGGPDGDAPGRPLAGEPRQPARSGQEREALVVRQPAVRLVAGEAPGPPLPRGPPVPPLHDRVHGGPGRGLARGRQRVLPDLLRPEQRRPVGRGRCGDELRSAPRSSATSGASRPIRPSRSSAIGRCR